MGNRAPRLLIMEQTDDFPAIDPEILDQSLEFLQGVLIRLIDLHKQCSMDHSPSSWDIRRQVLVDIRDTVILVYRKAKAPKDLRRRPAAKVIFVDKREDDIEITTHQEQEIEKIRRKKGVNGATSS